MKSFTFLKLSKQLLKLVAVVGLGLILSACGGGSSSNNNESPLPVDNAPSFTARELVDPTPGVGHEFGERVIVLSNGNVVVSDPRDSSIAASNGAVHLYNPRTQQLIASFFGDSANERLGGFSNTSVVALNNGNFVLSIIDADVNGVTDAGSVKLIDGATGAQIGATIAGDNANDNFGSVIALPNNNFVVTAEFDDVDAVINTGSVRLISGSTGQQLGATIEGDGSEDRTRFALALPNNNFFVQSSTADVNGIVDAGLARLINGATGAEISRFAGDDTDDRLASGFNRAVGNNFTLNSIFDDVAGVVNAGSVRLINGTTGAQIGNTIAGDNAEDRFGVTSPLSNGNFIIIARNDTVNGVASAGSVRLIDGVTGNQLGTAIEGDTSLDFSSFQTKELPNGNILIGTRADDVGGVVDAGSVYLLNGITGNQIGAAITGNNTEDFFGQNLPVLPNNNFLISAQQDDVGGITDVGSVTLVNGATGAQVGTVITGNLENDFFGAQVINNNFVVASRGADVNGITNAGSVQLFNGDTGIAIASSITGDVAEDRISIRSTALQNGNYLVGSTGDDVNGIVNAGSVQLVSGTTGTPIGTFIAGDNSDDFFGFDIELLANNIVAIMSERDNTDIGSVIFLDGTTGLQIGDAITGLVDEDVSDGRIIQINQTSLILSLPIFDNNGVVDSGRVLVIEFN